MAKTGLWNNKSKIKKEQQHGVLRYTDNHDEQIDRIIEILFEYSQTADETALFCEAQATIRLHLDMAAKYQLFALVRQLLKRAKCLFSARGLSCGKQQVNLDEVFNI